jgi:hypothetical protein
MSAAMVPQTDIAIQGFSLDDAEMKSLVRDLNRPVRRVYWTDLLLTSCLGWGAFALAVFSRPFSPMMLGAVVISVCAL